MTAVFTGLGSGFERGSAATLGGAGLLGSSSLGRAGVGVFLNAASGNLVVQQRDEFLVGLGPDVSINRTYNSLGTASHDDNGDLWRQSTDRRVYDAIGAYNTQYSTIKRLSADGSSITYTYDTWSDGSYYRATDGAGAHDKLTYASGVWTWSEGSSHTVETYEAAETGVWRIKTAKDSDGNTVTFTYDTSDPTILTKIATADGGSIVYVWNTAKTHIDRVETYATSGLSTPTLTRTYYEYDGQERLIKVIVDLSPNDNSKTDLNVYTTTYTYDGSSNRIASIEQTDGSKLEITYTSGQVTRLKQTVASGDERVTDIIYGSGTTEIRVYRDQTIPSNPQPSDYVSTVLEYDSAHQLTKLKPTPQAVEYRYAYDSDGNVLSVEEVASARTQLVEHSYDARGNATQTTVKLNSVAQPGSTITRTFDANNNLTLETHKGSSGASASGDLYTRYVYDSENHLRFMISSEGLVTEYSYTADGLLEVIREFTADAHRYTIGSTLPTEAQMSSWRTGLGDQSSAKVIKNFYDARGNLTQTARYGAATTQGFAATTDGATYTNFAYDQSGQLLSRYIGSQATETFAYDGLGRLILSTDLSGGTTSIVFEDANTKTIVTTRAAFNSGSGQWEASGDSLISTSVYNKAGQLISHAESGANTTTGQSLNAYDHLGRLRTYTDATNKNVYYLYNDLGQRTAEIAHDGQLTEYRYDSAGRVVATIRYATAISTSLVSNPAANVAIDAVRPSYVATDIAQWTVYDAHDRVIQTIMGDGSVTTYAYDDAGRLVATSGYANKVSVSGFFATPPTSAVSVTADATKDFIIRTFYDGDGRVIGSLNGEGYLTEIVYDASGQRIQDIAYATITNSSLRATGTFSALRAGLANTTTDVVTRYVYDGQGLLRFTIDGLGRVTENIYWQTSSNYSVGLVRKRIVHYSALGTLSSYGYAAVKTAVAALSGSANNRITHFVYDTRQQLVYTIDATGAVARLDYDASGRVTKETLFANLYDIANLGADTAWKGNLDTWSGSNGTGARISRRYYNGRGEARYTIDAEGYVTGRTYDAAGRVLTQSRYSAQLTPTDAWTFASVDGANKGTAATNSLSYDNLGRLVYDSAADGSFHWFQYYANGALKMEVAGTWADNARVTYYYDQAGKKTSEVRATSEIANTTSVGATATQLVGGQRALSANGQYSAVLTKFGEFLIYHKGEAIWASGSGETLAGATYRLVAETNGNLVLYRDVSGQASVVRWSSNTAGAHSGPAFFKMEDDGNFSFHKGTAPTSGGVIWSSGTNGVTAINATGSDWVHVYYAYDGRGNLISQTDAMGGVTTFAYDKAGRLTKQTNALSGVTEFTYNAFHAVQIKDARGNFSYSYFDKLGRLELNIDAAGYATETTYNAFGEVATTTRRALATTGATASVKPTITTDALDATTTFEYDKRGLVTKVTDALGAYEQYTLNAFGQRTAVRNKLGGIVNYAYDKRGLVVSETLPIASIKADGTQQASSVTNAFEYDSRGNRTKLIEAAGLIEQRTTTYEYDATNKLTRILHDSVSAATSSTGATSSVVPTEQFFYDVRGNLTEKRDANGARTLYWYDKLNRVTHEVSATGSLKRYFYDANGNVTQIRTYATTVTLPSDLARAAPIGTGAYRSTLYVYDALNRVSQVKTPNITTAAWNSTAFEIATADLVTAYDYDALNNVVKVTDANGAQTYSYYDALGRKTIQVDASLYQTRWAYNADGNVLSETRYANAGAAPSGTTTPPDPPTTDPTNDRTTTFTYDKMGRRLTETRASVKIHNGSGAHTTSSAVITYSYNGLGQVLSKTEASQDKIVYEYDVGGRLVREKRLKEGQAYAYLDFNNAQVTPTVEYSYNGLDDLTRTKALGNASAADRVTTYTYGAGGRLATLTDAVGFKRAYVYDAAGRVLREEYNRINFTSAANEAVGYDYDLEGRVTAQGFLVNNSGWTRSKVVSGVGETIETSNFQYNGYGEISQRGVNGVYSEQFQYDGAGRLTRTNAGDGAYKYFLYDKAGNQTLMVTSVGEDFTSAAFDTVAEIIDLWVSPAAIATSAPTNGSAPIGGWKVVATITKYDARGQAIQVLEPQRQLNATTSADLRTSRAYNAFGEVIRETNANGHDGSGNVITSASVEYAYNTMGRLIQITSPAVEGITGDGVGGVTDGLWISGYVGNTPTATSSTATTFRPIEHNYYDVSGRLVATRDANGNLTKFTLLEGTGYGGTEALNTSVIAADDGITVTDYTTTGYDIHGDARKLTDQIDRITTQTFDAMGRLTQANRPTTLVDYYEYDGLGQRIKHWNSQLGVGNAEQITFDEQGRIVQSVAAGGDTTSYTYGWSGTLATSGMGTFGGWTTKTTYANSKVMTQQADVFGRAVGQTDMGAHVATFTYDKAGRMTQRGGGSALNYTYFNTGRIATTAEGSIRTTTLGYNKLGQVVSEKLVASGQTHKDMTATYDALGRMTSWTEAGSSYVPGAWTTYAYDANGNIRHSHAEYHGISQYGDPSSSWSTLDKWYRYDGLNRLLTQSGKLINGAIVRDSVGTDYTYDAAGQRTQALIGFLGQYITGYEIEQGSPPIPIYDYFTGTQHVDYSYDAGGRVVEVYTKSSNHQGGWSTYFNNLDFVYDTMGRLTQRIVRNITGAAINTRTVTYNAKSQISTENNVQVAGSTTTNTTATYAYGSGTSYALGAALTITTTGTQTVNGNQSSLPTSLVTNTYQWWDGAVQSVQSYKPNTSSSTTHDSTYTYATIGGAAQLTSVYIDDGRPRTVTFRNDMNGQVIRRDEADNLSYGDPHEIWYRFAGKQTGFVGNNGAPDAEGQSTASGPFLNGTIAAVQYADFDLSTKAISSSWQGSVISTYVVQDGETLESIAAQLWGDSSLWWKLAEANGLTGSETLIAGQTLIVPAGVVRASHNASTFATYDPGEVINPVSPTVAPKPPKANKCGAFGQIVLIVIAIVVTAWTQGATAQFFGTLLGKGTVGAAIATGATAGAAGSIASQAVGVTTGIQDKFSWNAVALSAIGGGVGASGVGDQVAGALNAAKGSYLRTAIGGAVNNAVTQGIGAATGLQSKFSWAGVAAAAAGAMAGQWFTKSGIGNVIAKTIPGGAGVYAARGASVSAVVIADAATRSLIEGSDFGDNVMAALPNVIGQTIGEMVAGGVAGRNGNGASIAKKLAMNAGAKPYSGAKQVQQYRPVSADDPNLQWSDDPENPYAITKEEFLRNGGQFGQVGVLPPPEEPEIIVTGQRRTPRPELSPELREIARAAAQAAIAARRERRAAEFRADQQQYAGAYRAASAQVTRELGGAAWQFARDWAPGISDVNGFYEAYLNPNALTVGAAVVGLVPIGGDIAGKFLRHLDNVPLNHLDDIPGGNNVAYRRLSERDVEALGGGGGLTARDPTGSASAVDHILNRAGDSSPWISTTRRLDVAQGYRGDGPIAVIDLDRLPADQVEVWRSVDRNPLHRDVAGPVAHDGELAFQRSFWAEEVTVYQAIPPEAIIGVVR